MATENEPAKLLLPYLQRADELQKHEPLVAYYCRLYAMERGLKISPKERTKTTSSLLISLMNQLEKDKKSLTLGPDDHLHVEGFGLNVFAKADKQDRAGRADLNTAKTFYAASIFFEILSQFGELQPDLEQKQKYAVWKAADIRKALKEGRKPIPGPPGEGDEDLSVPPSASSGEYDFDSSGGQSDGRPDPNNVNQDARTSSDLSSQQYDKVNFHSSPSIPPQPSNTTSSPPSNMSTPHHYFTDDYPSHNFHSSSTSDVSGHPVHPQTYHQSYQPEHQPPQLPQHYPSQPPSFSYPNFQSYPSFTESSLPAAPSHYPSYYQGPDTTYSNLPPAEATSSAQYDSSTRRENISQASSTVAQKYNYDSNFEPPPEQIAEAQKAARFAVSALAFDDVFVAVEHLKNALEMLTKPSAGH